MKILLLSREPVSYLRTTFPWIILYNSTRFAFQCRIKSLFYLYIETVHINKGNYSVHSSHRIIQHVIYLKKAEFIELIDINKTGIREILFFSYFSMKTCCEY